jgi:hypothetical protein
MSEVERTEVEIKERVVGGEGKHHMGSLGIDKESGASAVSNLEKIAQFKFDALEPSGIEIDRIHSVRKIERDNE